MLTEQLFLEFVQGREVVHFFSDEDLLFSMIPSDNATLMLHRAQESVTRYVSRVSDGSPEASLLTFVTNDKHGELTFSVDWGGDQGGVERFTVIIRPGQLI